jgi:hypothetical protein
MMGFNFKKLGNSIKAAPQTFVTNTVQGAKKVMKGDIQGGVGQIANGTGLHQATNMPGPRLSKALGYEAEVDAKNAGPSPYANMTMPELGAYKSVLDDGTTLKINPITGKLDTSGVDELKRRALETGDSAWARMALEKNAIEQRGLLNSATSLAASEAANARASMAARGGLRGGAAMRLANQAQQNGALSRQNVFQQGALSRADIGLQDQLMKNQFLSQLPGAQLGVANYQTGIDQFNTLQTNEANKFNIDNTIKDRTGKNAWDQLAYQEQMKLKGAGMTADAIARSGNQNQGLLSGILG